MKSTAFDLSISIVIYNSSIKDLEVLFESYVLTIDFAKSLGLVKNDAFYIIDNFPSANQKILIDQLSEKYKVDSQYIASHTNGGYGHGHNQAIKLINSDFHIICNPDIQFHQDTIVNALNFFTLNKNTVLLCPAVFGIDGNRHYLCKQNPKLFHLFLRRFCPGTLKRIFFKKYLERFEYRDHSYDDQIRNVPFCTGAFMFFETKGLQKLNGFDERFFLYMEDADLSRRALSMGGTAYDPTVKVIHRWERGSYKDKVLRNAAIKSAFTYYLKWGGLF